MEQRISKWPNGHPCYDSSVWQSTSETGEEAARATGLILENRRFKILGLFTAMGMSIRKVDTFVNGEVGVTI